VTPLRLFRCAAALVLALVFFSCTSPALRVTGIPIAKDATFDLLSPASLGQSISLEQVVDAKYGDRSFTFHCLLEVDEKHLVLVGLTPFNSRAFTLTLKDDELAIDIAPGAQLPAEPSRILSDLQLALWPKPQVRGLELVHFRDSQGRPGREFRRDGTAVLRIAYDETTIETGVDLWGKRLLFQNLEQSYTLDVRTVHAEKLAP
jgi:hypothetical protein